MKQGYHQWFTVDFNIDWRPIAVSDPDFNENAAYGYSFFEIILFWFDLKVGSNISRRRDCVLPLSKHREDSWKYNAQWSIENQRTEIIKIYAY